MRSRVTGTLLVCALLAVAVAGCGGDDGGDEARAADGDRVAPEQWAREATAVCRRHRRQIAAGLDAFLADRGGDGGGGAVVAQAMQAVIIPGFWAQYEELRRLRPPRHDEDFLDLMLSKLSRSLESGEEELPRLFRVKPSGYSEFAEGTLMTEEYGVEGCGSLARSPAAVYRPFLR